MQKIIADTKHIVYENCNNKCRKKCKWKFKCKYKLKSERNAETCRIVIGMRAHIGACGYHLNILL